MHLHKAGITKEQFEQSGIYQAQFAIYACLACPRSCFFFFSRKCASAFHAPFWRTMRWSPLDTGKLQPAMAYLGFVAGGFLLSILVALASSAFSPKHKMPIEQYFQDRHTALLLLIMSVTVAPFFEETIFRGYLYPVVARSFGVAPGVF